MIIQLIYELIDTTICPASCASPAIQSLRLASDLARDLASSHATPTAWHG